MNKLAFRLYLNDTLVSDTPTLKDFDATFEAVKQNPESYFILEGLGAFLQGVYESDKGFRCEYKREPFTDETQYVSVDHVEQHLLSDLGMKFIQGSSEWFQGVEWEELVLVLDEDEEVILGVFEPSDARKIVERLLKMDVEIDMEQVGVSLFELRVKARQLDLANKGLTQALDLQV